MLVGVVVLAAVAVAAHPAGAADPLPPPATNASTAPLKDMGDAFLVDQDGGWFCPRGDVEATAVCPEDVGEGHTSAQFAELMIEDIVAHPELDPPMYLRVGKARNDCSIVPGSECTTGVPPTPTTACPAVTLPPDQYTVTTPYCALRGLKDVGIQLGVVVGAAGDEDEDAKPARSVQDITYQACRIHQADTDHLYDFMFLDLAFKLSDADLIDVVNKLQGGTYWDPAAGAYQTCPYGAWPKLITNDTTYPARTLATGAWGHAKSFALLSGDDWQAHAEQAAAGTFPAIRDEDTDFIHDVHAQDPGSHPVLRFEVPSQTDRFAELSGDVQCNLLRRWAKQQKQSTSADDEFSIIYAFYVHALPDTPNTYDSLFRGTYQRQRELIHYYNPDLPGVTLSACPQAPR
jgi:hypothetical protein